MKKLLKNLIRFSLIFNPIVTASCTKWQEAPFDDKLLKAKNDNSRIIGLKDEECSKLNLDQLKIFIEKTDKIRLKENFVLEGVQKEKGDLILKISGKKYSLKSLLKSLDNVWGKLENNYQVREKDNIRIIEKGKGKTDVSMFFENDNLEFKNKEYFEYYKEIFRSKYNDLLNVNKDLPDLQLILQKTFLGNGKFSLRHNQLNSNLLRIENIFDKDAILNQFKEYFEDQVTFYLKAYKIVNKDNLEFDRLVVTIKEKENNNNKQFLKINVDMLDKSGVSLLNNEQKNKIFYLTDFQDTNERYHSFKKYGNFEIDSSLGDKKEKSLFNEMFKDATLNFEKNIFNISDFDSLMHPLKPYLSFNLNSFMQFFNAYKDEIKINLVDKNYEAVLENIEFDKLLNNSHSIGKATVKITNKQNKKSSKTNWFTIDFTNAHKHIFDGFYIQNKLDCDNLNSDEYFSYHINKGVDANNELILPKGIVASEFYEKNLKDIVNFVIYQNRESLSIWNNKKMSQNSVLEIIQNKEKFEKILSTLISQYVLKFFINNEKLGYKNLIKEVKVTIDSDNDYDVLKYGVGKLPIKIDFINHDNEDMIDGISEKNRKFLLGGFIGFNFSDVDAKVKSLSEGDLEKPLKDKTPPFLLDI